MEVISDENQTQPLPIIWFSEFSPDGEKVVTTSCNNTARVWDVETGHTNTVWSVAFSPDGDKIITTSWDNTARVWAAMTGELLRILRE